MMFKRSTAPTARRLLDSVFRHFAVVGLAFFLTTNTALAAPLNFNISDVPLDVQEGVEPNIVYTIDDSGSMFWEFLPDGIWPQDGTNRGYSSLYNLIYYNPAFRYTPAVDEYGVSLGDIKPTAAWHDGFRRNTGTVDLTNNFRQQWWGWLSYSGEGAQTAFYYYFDTTKTTGGNACDPNNTAHVNNSDACYTKRTISPGNAPFPGSAARTDCAIPTACTYAEEIQNFANWYSYYRNRTMLAKAATTRAFSRLSPKVRVGYQTLNEFQTIGLVQEFSGANRTAFFDWLTNDVDASGGTPLQAAYNRAGYKFQEAGPLSPYAKVPGGGQPGDDEEYACRQNFHVAFTDGFWNSEWVFTGDNPNGINDEDDDPVSFPANPYGVTGYNPMPPYEGNENRYLADIAFYYWAHDLRPGAGGLANDVPTYTPYTQVDYDNDGDVDNDDIFWNPQNDPANWQHLVTFSVNMGLSGQRVYDPDDPYGLSGGGGDWPAIKAGTQSWGNDHADDLWHAAINGRGEYFVANNPDDLVNRFNAILDNISKRKGSGTAPATSFPLYASDTIIYQPRFDTADWSGDLLAIDVTNLLVGTTSNAQLTSLAAWSAAARLELMTPANRAIYTYDPDTGNGVRFLWADMTNNGLLQNWLNTDETGSVDTLGDERVAYLRGDRSLEQSNGGSFRNRKFLLGDLVNSTPIFVGEPYRFYPDNFEAVSYRSFKATYETRPRRVYVGSNDGMLHAFDAGAAVGDTGTGDEVMAYVPSAVVRYLPLLPATNYTHRFYADGSPTEADVFYNNAWHTVLVAGLNAGGQGFYALDITDGVFDGSAADAQARVLWEFTDLDDADLGFTYAQPRVAKTNLSSGQWAVFAGNGYNSTFDDTAIGGQVNGNPASQGRAILFILDVETGTVIKKMDTGEGAAQDPTGQNRPNGLSTVETVDINGDRKVDLIYAGDIFGNLWKFDVQSDNTNQWKVSKLFTATYDNGGTTEYQPITAPPRVIAHPDGVGEGVIVLFGTGKHFELSDLSDPSVQTMYGVWDRLETNTTTFDRDSLYEQQILGVDTTTFANAEARVTTEGEFDWYQGNNTPPTGATEYLGWFMDLVEPGEKMVKEMFVRNGRLVFVTDTPSPDPCQNGGSSWLMEVSAAYGSRLSETPFDFDGDGQFGVGDEVPGNFDGDNQPVIASGIRTRTPGGRFSAPTILNDPTNGGRREKKILSNSDGTITMVDENTVEKGLGRRSWRQILSD